MLKEIDKKIDDLHQERIDLIAERIRNCDHPKESIRECEYREGVLFLFRPERVCLKCGLVEEGWVYHALAGLGSVRQMTRDEMRKHCLYRISDEELTDIRIGRKRTLKSKFYKASNVNS